MQGRATTEHDILHVLILAVIRQSSRHRWRKSACQIAPKSRLEDAVLYEMQLLRITGPRLALCLPSSLQQNTIDILTLNHCHRRTCSISYAACKTCRLSFMICAAPNVLVGLYRGLYVATNASILNEDLSEYARKTDTLDSRLDQSCSSFADRFALP